MENYAIKYNAKRMEVNSNIEKVKKIGISVDFYEKIVQEIDQKTKKEIDDSLADLENVSFSCFYKDIILVTYSKAVEQLDQINTRLLEEYKEYLIIFQESSKLNQQMKQGTLESDWIDNTLQILQRLRNSSNMPYEWEQNIVENVFSAIYSAMKIELSKYPTTKLLDYVKQDSVAKAYVEELIREDIQKYNQNNISKIHAAIYPSLLDANLIFQLGEIDNNQQRKFERKSQEYFESEEQLTDIESDKRDLDCYQAEILKTRNYLKSKKLKWRIALLFNFAFVGTGLFLAYHSDKLAKETIYKTTTAIVTSKELESQAVEYLDATDNSTTFVEYSPWEDSDFYREEYARNVYTYDLKDILDDNLEEVPDEEHCAFLIAFLLSILMETIIALFFLPAKINWKQKWKDNAEEYKEYEEKLKRLAQKFEAYKWKSSTSYKDAIQIYQNLPYAVREKEEVQKLYLALTKETMKKEY